MKRRWRKGRTYKLSDVNDWNLVAFLLGLLVIVHTDQRPQFVDIEGRAEAMVAVQMEVAHTDFAEISRMIFVVVDSVMVHATSVTTTTGMLTVLACKERRKKDV
jgi:hypothetical protein